MTVNDFLSEWNNESSTITLMTSGSTGKPKSITVEKERMRESARRTCRFLGLSSGDTALLCLPIDYIAGKMMVVRSIVAGLNLTTISPTSHPFAQPETFGKRFDLVALVPQQVHESLTSERETSALKSVRHIIIGGGPIDRGQEASLQDFPHAVWSTYGMTETLSHIALRRLNGQDASEWYYPFEGIAVSLSHAGCLILDAPGICNEPLTTNDLAEIGADGRSFKILGRIDNVVNSGGIKLQIEEIEQTIRPWIKGDFIVTKSPDKLLGEALTLLLDRESPEDPGQLKDRLHERLPRFHAPKHIYRVDKLPYTPNGKPARAEAALLARRLTLFHKD